MNEEMFQEILSYEYFASLHDAITNNTYKPNLTVVYEEINHKELIEDMPF